MKTRIPVLVIAIGAIGPLFIGAPAGAAPLPGPVTPDEIAVTPSSSHAEVVQLATAVFGSSGSYLNGPQATRAMATFHSLPAPAQTALVQDVLTPVSITETQQGYVVGDPCQSQTETLTSTDAVGFVVIKWSQTINWCYNPNTTPVKILAPYSSSFAILETSWGWSYAGIVSQFSGFQYGPTEYDAYRDAEFHVVEASYTGITDYQWIEQEGTGGGGYYVQYT